MKTLLPLISLSLVALFASTSQLGCGGTRSSSPAISTSNKADSSNSSSGSLARTAAQKLPRPDHIVVVIEENKSYEDILGSGNAPYLKSLASQGAVLSKFYALHHPSQANYVELFSGTDGGVYNDDCPPLSHGIPFTNPSLGGTFISNGGFIGFAEGLPASVSNWNALCHPTTHFAEKHCPWLNFQDVPASASQDFKQFPRDAQGFKNLPALSFVIPDLVHDMHGLSPSDSITQEVASGDQWLRVHLDAYAQWAKANNSLLIVTWDEDSSKYTWPANPSQKIVTSPPQNHIATILVGSMIKAGTTNDQTYTHYDLLRTIEDMYKMPLLGNSDKAKDIVGIWQM